jgi:hypothetical protein
MTKRRPRTEGVRVAGTRHSRAIPVNDADAMTPKRELSPPPGDRSVDFKRRVAAGGATSDVVGLMDALAEDLGLTSCVSHSTVTYRYGSRGAAVWIEPTQSRFVVDLRTLAQKYPAADVPKLHTAFTKMFRLSNSQMQQPAVRISNLVVQRWDDFERDVLRPFFRVQKLTR